MYPYLALLALCAAAADERVLFSSEAGNYRLTYPAGWEKLRSPNDAFQLVIGRRGSVIMVGGNETSGTREELLDEFVAGAKTRADSLREVARKEVTVAGEKAVRVELNARRQGVKSVWFVTLFTHQGVGYQVVGIRTVADATFERDYASVLESFAFLRERKEWLAKYEGRPRRTALLGGLASFELNRPRWREITFEERADYGPLDRARFGFLPGGAWVTVRAQEAHGDAAAELELLRHSLAGRVLKPRADAVKVQGRRGEQPALEIRGVQGEHSYATRATVVVEDGIAVQVWLDCYQSQYEATRRDWEQLVRGFQLQRRSKPEQPLAFPLRREPQKQPADPALAAFLGRATPVLSGPARFQLRAVSPDGKQALLVTPQGTFIEDLATHRREPIAANPPSGRPVAWSRDGRRLAVPLEREVVIISRGGGQPQKVLGAAIDLAFGPGPDDLLLCSRDANGANPAVAPRLVTTRLERVGLSDAVRQTLVDFPLARVSHPAVSPDGKRIALVCNRDYPRTAPAGGHLYVCAADGSELRQLTRGAEDISAVTWSADGQSLYAVRRLSVGDGGAVGVGGPADLYRLPAGGGEPVNLTRSGRIGRAWVAGADVLLEINAWDVAAAQQGVFRIAVSELETATAGRPIPPAADPRARAKAVADKVRGALGTTRLADVVPTSALMGRLARAFADAVTASGVALDFSAASLDRLSTLAEELDLASGREPAVVLGFGAYYGETLRRVAGAEWAIAPLPFGEWTPGRAPSGNPLVDVILPLSDPYRWGLRTEDVFLRRSGERLDRLQGQKLILVYPPRHAEEALKAATPAEYRRARRLLDDGEVKDALDLLAVELRRRPKNEPLAREVIAVCEAARLPVVARDLTRQAVEGGNEVPELLLRYADEVAREDPERALTYYRKAVQGDWAPAEAFVKLGKQYAALEQPAVAESCWRRAYPAADETQRREIRRLMELDTTGERGEP
jgi:hypothetical protein